MILYYSRNCKHCQKLLNEHNTNGLSLVCVEDIQNIPSYINEVPTVVDTSTDRLYIGKHAFEYISKNKVIDAYEFDIRNNMKTGYSMIDSDQCIYQEPENFEHIQQ